MRGERPKPKKALGQHFLRDERVCIRIARLLELEEKDELVEIGPGPGALTRFLQSAPHKSLILLEKDKYWATERARLADKKTTALEADALFFDWTSLRGDGWKITGNLPYNIASPLIWDILSTCPGMKLAVFMVQKEVGERLAARPGNGAYGALSVWAQSHASAKLEFKIGPGAFYPPPRVDSAVVKFRPLPQAELPGEPESLKRLLRLCFQNRRKQLGGIFKRANAPILLEGLLELGIPETMRPENLDPKVFQQLAEIWVRKS